MKVLLGLNSILAEEESNNVKTKSIHVISSKDDGACQLGQNKSIEVEAPPKRRAKTQKRNKNGLESNKRKIDSFEKAFKRRKAQSKNINGKQPGVQIQPAVTLEKTPMDAYNSNPQPSFDIGAKQPQHSYFESTLNVANDEQSNRVANGCSFYAGYGSHQELLQKMDYCALLNEARTVNQFSVDLS